MKMQTFAALFAAIVMASGTGLYAQQRERDQPRTQQSEAGEAHHSAGMMQKQSLTGCLEKGDEEGSYILKVAVSGDQLERHVGHKIRVTGSSGDSQSASASQGASRSGESQARAGGTERSEARSRGGATDPGERAGAADRPQAGRAEPGAEPGSQAARAGQRGESSAASRGGSEMASGFQVSDIQHISASCDQ